MSTVLESALEIRVPDDCEVIHGEIVELPPLSFYAREVANILNLNIYRYLLSHDTGRTRVEECFRIPQPDDPGRNRQPDMVFVSYDRWPRNHRLPYTGNALNVVPDLAVEVVSPTDPAGDVVSKAREYLRGGVRLVWVVYPDAREVHAYRPDGPVKVFLNADELLGEELLPGFRMPVSDLFPELIDPPVAPEEREDSR